MWRQRWKVRMNARVPSPLSGVRVNVNGASRNWHVCVPVRNVWGTITFESLPAEKRTHGSPRWNGQTTDAWYWADGKRSIAEIARTHRMDERIARIMPGFDAPFFQAGLAGYSDGAMRLVARRHIRLGTRQLDQQRGILNRQAQSVKRLDERAFAVGFADYIPRRRSIIPEFRGRRLRIQLI
jgi:hypothetical protein